MEKRVVCKTVKKEIRLTQSEFNDLRRKIASVFKEMEKAEYFYFDISGKSIVDRLTFNVDDATRKAISNIVTKYFDEEEILTFEQWHCCCYIEVYQGLGGVGGC